MKLQDFVAETLNEIVVGVKKAQASAVEQGAMINPLHILPGNARFREVDFDVAVTTSEGTEKERGLGVFVGSLGAGAKGKTDVSNVTVNRITFSVPVLLPRASAH